MSSAAANVSVSTSAALPNDIDLFLFTRPSPSCIRTVRLRSRNPTSEASSALSAEDEPLYMARRPSLSHAHSSPTIPTWPSRKQLQDERLLARENEVWDVIDKEISHWQNVAETGRPGWYTSSSKWSRKLNRSAWDDDLRGSYVHRGQTKQLYLARRRAATDSYIDQNDNVQGLARLVAVQLLSSCFTLPPDGMARHKSSGHRCFDTLGSLDISNSGWISSLRMHVEFRYSPAFGHDARSPSPNLPWEAMSEGSDTSIMQEGLADEDVLEGLGFSSARGYRTIRGSLDGSDTSSNEILLSDGKQKGRNRKLFRIGRGWKRNRSEFNDLPPPSSLPPTDQYRSTERSKFQYVARSDPPHLVPQPVKDTLVRRLERFSRTLRRRFSGDDQGASAFMEQSEIPASPTRKSREQLRYMEGYGSLGALNERRRGTRERSDIFSDHFESSYTQDNGTLFHDHQPGTCAPQIELATHFHNSKLRNDDFSFTRNVRLRKTASRRSLASPPAETPATRSSSISRMSTQPQVSGRSTSHTFPPGRTLTVDPLWLNHGPPRATKRVGKRVPSQRRRRARSMLSEVYTPEDFEESRRTSSEVVDSSDRLPKRHESQLRSLSVTVAGSSRTDHSDQVNELSLHDRPALGSSQDIEEEHESNAASPARPFPVRISTSGSLIITPSRDGIEIDGMPAGPPASHWDCMVDGKVVKGRGFL
jgi:hypothetical protein